MVRLTLRLRQLAPNIQELYLDTYRSPVYDLRHHAFFQLQSLYTADVKLVDADGE